jgi:septal ring factor EnvC (AmiA/AmiB activator)
MMKQLTKRARPDIADRNKDAGAENIREKLRALKSLVKHDNPGVRATGPHSTRQFCKWQSGTSPDTLRKREYRDEAAAVKTLTALCKAAAAEVEDTKNRKVENVAALRRKCELHQVIREIAETELVKARRELLVANSRSMSLEAQLASSKLEASKHFAELDAQLDGLRFEIAALTADRRKIVGMRRIDK